MPDPPVPPRVPPPARPVGASRYGWLVGVLAIVILAYILLNTLRTHGPGSQGPRTGTQLPPFAAPLLLSPLDGDVNLAVHPDKEGVTACSVRGPNVLNSCDLTRGAPTVIGFFFTRGAHCEGSFDAIERLSKRTPGVHFAGIAVKDRGSVSDIARRHGWTFPIGYDRDGQLATTYGIAGCPEVVLAYPGGVVRATLLGGDRAERQLGAHVAGLVAASRARGWRPGR
jgi:peroxiredoxin